ncbi:9470_t:CDS:2, partial [Acaulospora colombiana]
KEGKSMEYLRFLYDGNRIQPEDTPASLEMEDDDRIDVMYEQT